MADSLTDILAKFKEVLDEPSPVEALHVATLAQEVSLDIVLSYRY